MTTKRITEFTFLDFMKSVEESILEGYRLDFDNIDNVPQRFGNTYECGMKQKEVMVISPMLTPEQVQELMKGGIMLADSTAELPAAPSVTSEVSPDVVVQSSTVPSTARKGKK